jgi:hypothetical protein
MRMAAWALAASLTACAQNSVKRYSKDVLPPSQSVEVFHSVPTRPYTEIGEVSQEGIDEPTGDMIAKAKELGADAVYFLKPEETGRRAMYASAGRSIYRHRAIAVKWK